MAEDLPTEKRVQSSRRVRTSHRQPSAGTGKGSATEGGKYLLVAGLILTVALGGGTAIWAKGLLLAAVGLWAIVSPPRITPSRKLDWCVALLFLWSLTAFIPNGLLGSATWREGLEEAGVQLGWMTSPQPWVSLEAVLMLLGGILWFYMIWNAEPSYEDRRRLLWVFTIGASILAVGQIIAAIYNWRSPFQAQGLGFSYFPNKNQTGLFFAMSGSVVFGLTVHLLRCRRRSALLSSACLLACFLAVIFSLSRAAILLFFVGCLISYLTAFKLRSAFRLMRFVIPLVIIGMSVLLVMGRESLARFNFWKSGSDSEMRLAIYHDTADMMMHLTPTGLTAGNFAWVFPQFREQSQSAMSVIHPESDWLWLVAELGIPALALVFMAVFLAMGRLVPFGDERSVAYRAPAVGALVIFLIHSFVDVPAHRLGTLLLAFLFYRLAVATLKSEPRAVLPRWLWRVAGGICLTAGIIWTLAGIFNLPWTTSLADAKAREGMSLNFTTESKERILESIDDAIAIHPLDWVNYTMRARYRLNFDRDSKGASEDFMIARMLEPTNSEVPFQEGVTWMAYSPRQAALAWREALNRHSIVPISLYREMLDVGSRRPQFARELNNLSIIDPGLRYHYLMKKGDRAFDETIYYELTQDPTFQRFSSEQRRNLLEHWAAHGDGATLREHLQEYPSLTQTPWYYNGLSWAAAKNYPQAIETVQPYISIPRFPNFTQFSTATTGELRQAFLLNPSDVVRGSILLQRQIEAQDWEAARNTAGLLMKNENVPDYAYYWKGELDRQSGFSEEAWKAWTPYIKQLVLKRANENKGSR